MGPGIVTAMAGNDAGGISTYSTAGANFGFGTLWVIPIMCVLLAVVETTAGRMGAVTGKGFAALIRERFGIRIAAFAMLALLVGNVATTFSEFAGHRLGHGDVRRVEVHFGARGGPRRVAARGGRLLQARAAGVPRAVAGVSHLCGGGVPRATELGRGAA